MSERRQLGNECSVEWKFPVGLTETGDGMVCYTCNEIEFSLYLSKLCITNVE